MKKLNLRLRLTVFFIVISVAVFATAGILSWTECREKVDEFFDTYQIALARRLSTANWEQIAPGMQEISDGLVKDIRNADDEDDAVGFAVFNSEGRRIFHDGENGRDFHPFGRTGSFGTEDVDEEDWRVIRMMTTDGKYIVAVGQELDYRREVTEDMFEEFMAPWGIGLIVLLTAIIVMLTLEFMPLKRLAADLKKRPAEDLSPLDEANIPDEVRPLTDAVNGLFKRIERMLQRERSFIADSAHELRSPLTALKVQLEVARMNEDDPKKLDDTLRKLERGIDRAAHLVEQLLALSRIDSSFEREHAPLDWREIVALVTDEYARSAREKEAVIRKDISGPPPFSEGNPVWAALMLRNLVDNALKYSPAGSEISISVKDEKLAVCNSNTAVPEERLKHLCERFYRPSGQKTDGSGLGLAIVSEIAAVHGCCTDCANTPNGFCVTVYRKKNSS